MAKRAVLEQIRSEGKHPCRMKAADIAAKAQAYLDAHPQLYWVALDRACELRLIDPGDRERFLDLLEITRYFAVRQSDSANPGIEKPREIEAREG
jgi:hypothetical protein